MTVRHRLLAFLLLPLLAAGVGGLRWGHVAVAHGGTEGAAETACSHRHRSVCGHSHGPVATRDHHDAAADRSDDSTSPTPRHGDDCLDCDLLAVMVGGATLDVPLAVVARPILDRAIDRSDAAAIAACEVLRARPPPVA